MSSTSLITPYQISHGTVECNDIEKTRRFLTDFLGLDVVRALKEAQYISKGGPWSVVCVALSKPLKPQSYDNRFELSVASKAEVDDAYAKAVRLKDEFSIREIRPVEEKDGRHSFALQDLNGAWWEISDFSMQDLDALFEGEGGLSALQPLLEPGILSTAIAAVPLNLYFNGAINDAEEAIEAAKLAEAH